MTSYVNIRSDLKHLLQGLFEPEFYGDLVYIFRKVIGKYDFRYHFKKIIVRHTKIGYNRLHAWLLIQSRLTTLLTSLISGRYIGLRAK